MKNNLSSNITEKYFDKIKANIKLNQAVEHKIIERKKKNINILRKNMECLKIDNEFVEKALKKNNEFRKLHGIEELLLDDYLVKRAFILAKKMFKDFCSEDLSYKDGSEIGANFEKCDIILEPEKLMDKWYCENKKYNFIEPIELENNNFTQMIWKNSKRFGIGYYFTKTKDDEKNLETKKYYYVALYYPAGNIPGEYKGNIFKKKSLKNQSKNNLNNDTNNKIDSHNKEIQKEIIFQNSNKIKIIKAIKIVLLILILMNNIWKMYIDKNQFEKIN